jgi:hypothetical protein
MRTIEQIQQALVAAVGGDDEALLRDLREELREAKTVHAAVLAAPAATVPAVPAPAQSGVDDIELAELLADVTFTASQWPNVTIERIGNWLWLTGDTKPLKQDLQNEGWRWHSKKTKERTDGKGVYYWMPPEVRGRKRRHSNKDLDEIRSKYGSAVLK